MLIVNKSKYVHPIQQVVGTFNFPLQLITTASLTVLTQARLGLVVEKMLRLASSHSYSYHCGQVRHFLHFTNCGARTMENLENRSYGLVHIYQGIFA